MAVITFLLFSPTLLMWFFNVKIVDASIHPLLYVARWVLTFFGVILTIIFAIASLSSKRNKESKTWAISSLVILGFVIVCILAVVGLGIYIAKNWH